MDIIEFSEYMFISNKENKVIHLDLIGIENNKDLFLFFIDLFCKGLVLCYGENNSVNFDDLDIEKFAHIKTKMANAGIHITLEMIDNPIELPTSINSQDIENESDNKPLEDYIFKIYKGYHTYYITFKLTRTL
jgi:hypothetical protein